MTRSVRFTSFDFDQSRYGSMLSDFEAIQKGVLDGIAGLARTRIVRTAADHLMGMSTYESMEELEAANDAHASIFSDFAKYVTGEPVIRSGEVIEINPAFATVLDASSLKEFGYMRFTRVIFDPSSYDAMMSSLNGQLEKLFRDVSGLYLLRVVRIADDLILAAAAYTDRSSADAARDTAQAALSGMAEYMTEPPFLREGDLAWSYVR